LKTIVFFNNKGGVGKTTLACNLVSFLNRKMDKRVLLIDADPQCNATQAIISDQLSEKIYLEESNEYDTLYSALQPLEDGEPRINPNIKPLLGTGNRFGTDLIPGHPKMSIIEDKLSDGWSDLRARELRGFRITNWCHHLSQQFKDSYDYVVFDVGPSLGALNRSVILASDYIVTPFGCDIFSLLGIRNIAGWISAWNSDYVAAAEDFSQKYPNKLFEYHIIEDTTNSFRFAGYSIQQYVMRKFKEGARPVKSYEQIMQEIPETVEESMKFLINRENAEQLELGHIPYLYSLIPMAQAAKAPIHELRSTDGLVGSQYSQVKSYIDLMEAICWRLMKNIGDGK
jgi:cellulose biosynthesis protein BcsQ